MLGTFSIHIPRVDVTTAPLPLHCRLMSKTTSPMSACDNQTASDLAWSHFLTPDFSSTPSNEMVWSRGLRDSHRVSTMVMKNTTHAQFVNTALRPIKSIRRQSTTIHVFDGYINVEDAPP